VFVASPATTAYEAPSVPVGREPVSLLEQLVIRADPFIVAVCYTFSYNDHGTHEILTCLFKKLCEILYPLTTNFTLSNES